MAKLTHDATRTVHGLVINEKIIPWGSKWPNANMGDARVHYYVDKLGAWQNLGEDEVGWHAGDSRGPGNGTALAIEVIMVGDGRTEDKKAEENGILLAAILLHRHGLGIDKLYTHNHWMGQPDSIVQGARKNCPLYILPHWAAFKAKIAELNGSSGTVETVTEGKAEASTESNTQKPVYVIGEIVDFAGAPHHISANAETYKTTPAPGPAEITDYRPGTKHPYHIIHTDKTSSVHGWVDEETISKAQASTPTYTIVNNDSLWDIAEEFLGSGARYPEIKELNGLKSNVIYTGQKLKIPA